MLIRPIVATFVSSIVLVPLGRTLGAHQVAVGAAVSCDSIETASDSAMKARLRVSLTIGGRSATIAADEVWVVPLDSAGSTSGVIVVVGRSERLSDNVLVALLVDHCFFNGGARSMGWGLHYSPRAQEQWNSFVGQAPARSRVADSEMAVSIALGYLIFATGRLLLLRSDTGDRFSSSATVAIETASGWLVTGSAWDNLQKFELRMTRSGKIQSISIK